MSIVEIFSDLAFGHSQALVMARKLDIQYEVQFCEKRIITLAEEIESIVEGEFHRNEQA